MPRLDETSDENIGQPLPFRTYEQQPRRAVTRGRVIFKVWRRRTGATPSALIQALSRRAARFAALPLPANVDEETLARYSIFVRLSAALWALRRAPASFDPTVASLLTREDESAFAHDEFQLFLAAKMRSCGLPADVPAPAVLQGVSNPDLFVPDATVTGAPIYWEVKERNPTRSHEQGALSAFILQQMERCAEQIRRREPGARGFASIDLGIASASELPEYLPAVEHFLRGDHERRLLGIMVSMTLLQLVRGEEGDFFRPVFRSHMLDTSDVYDPTTGLRPAVIEALHRAFKPAAPSSNDLVEPEGSSPFSDAGTGGAAGQASSEPTLPTPGT